MERKIITKIKEDRVFYPESDGKPMAENTLQFHWITLIKCNLDILFEDEEVFVAGDLLWYPVQGRSDIAVAPDALVVFGRPQGYRGSYQQWKEDNIPPKVVFEILSPSNTYKEMRQKQQFYEQYGVDEFYIYDPDENTLDVFIRKNNKLEEEKYKTSFWKSPLLNIVFELNEKTLSIFYPDGTPFLTSLEYKKLINKEKFEKENALKERAEEQKAKEEALLEKAEEEKALAEAFKQIEQFKKEIEQFKKKPI